MPHVDNRGVRITYRLYGEGEPLVLIHGWSCEGRYWDEFGYTTKLSAEYKVIAPDLRGHGDSETPEDGDFTDRAFVSDVIAVLDDLAIDSAHVFGGNRDAPALTDQQTEQSSLI
ncbi:alpha/beta hydrolase [Acidobacteria bacterium AH-259-G07]|nr:alpha/beta hydrolase [Acidobacteria bacterium AH-259-G07]